MRYIDPTNPPECPCRKSPVNVANPQHVFQAGFPELRCDECKEYSAKLSKDSIVFNCLPCNYYYRMIFLVKPWRRLLFKAMFLSALLTIAVSLIFSDCLETQCWKLPLTSENTIIQIFTSTIVSFFIFIGVIEFLLRGSLALSAERIPCNGKNVMMLIPGFSIPMICEFCGPGIACHKEIERIESMTNPIEIIRFTTKFYTELEKYILEKEH